MMFRDPIVEEIHAIRAKLLDECGGDLDIYMQRLKERERLHADRLVTFEEIHGRKPGEPAPKSLPTST